MQVFVELARRFGQRAPGGEGSRVDVLAHAQLEVEAARRDAVPGLGLAVQKRFGIKIDAEAKDTRKHFASVDSLAAYIDANRAVA